MKYIVINLIAVVIFLTVACLKGEFVTGVSFDLNEVTLSPGESMDLKATVMPDNANDKTLYWESNHPDLINVDKNGRVTVLNIIIHIDNNGLYYYHDNSGVRRNISREGNYYYPSDVSSFYGSSALPSIRVSTKAGEYDAFCSVKIDILDSWVQKANFAGGNRTGAVGFAIGDKGYIVTGEGNRKDFWEYDPVSNRWTQKADFAGEGRSGAVGFAVGNKGYIGTGFVSNSNGNRYLQDFWEYDPALNRWTQKADFAGGGRSSAVGFAIGNKGYIGTGSYIGGGYVRNSDDFWEYDPVLNSWTQKADFAGEGRSNAVGFAIGNKGYVGTGYYSYQDFWEYDPVSNRWTQKADFAGEGRYSAVGFAIGNKGYVGTGGRDFWEYDPASNSWIRKANFTGGRYNAVGFSIGNKGYVGTGSSSSSSTNHQDFWEFTP